MFGTAFRAIGGILLSTTASFFVTWAVSNFLVNGFPPEALVTAIVVPLIIATPLSIYISVQRTRLDQTNSNLQAALDELEELHADAEQRAQTDLMTGVFNREHFIQMLSSKRGRRDVGTFLMLDADHFKRINDTWGHKAGDTALIAIVEAVNNVVREGDVVGRLGGEEFGVYLTGTPLEKALTIAERIRKEVERIRFEPETGHIHPLTVSMGAAELSSKTSVSDVMQSADELLYHAKKQGRNRVLCETPSSGSTFSNPAKAA